MVEDVGKQLTEAFGTADANSLTIPQEGVVAVILAYNEVLRFPYFLQHFRAIGVRHFIVIDNNSTDGTYEFLTRQQDVSIIRTSQPYSDYKSVWRQLICERYLQERWVLFPDVDELFVYPGWPDLSIDQLVAYLESAACRALFCPMVDMYPKGPLREVSYKSGESFLDACPWFDSTGYRFNPLKGSHRRRYKSPPRHVFGGTRERLFHQNAKRDQTRLDRVLLSRFFGLSANVPESALGRQIDHILFKAVKDALPDVAAVQSKIPLIKWQSGYKFSGGVHGIDKRISIAPDWGALLHFKYLDDFQSKVTEAIDRKQHTGGASHYQDYRSQMERLMDTGMHYKGSSLFSGSQSLIECGLMRESDALRRWIDRVA
ncbi:MAG: glycosyltransferase family 2 protein [Roseibium sp.]|uniref:glycosyltransferase family 2 protein n=1 Tax=Roseibium sp. TaxID=1936156 RepID=UPI001AFF3333|nr:glycosyltransferase family 2 protein [Roseibium sp.]MBO6891890.1 glycosyltransferase family 2 protein [Roseibium sp.]MBO6929243.1 glycosyltransferase family 2 protein [Roseibium sp.]